jgi:glycosyltransferase involved in cell wall biosynthesis
VDRFIAVSEAVAIGNGLEHHRLPVDVIPNFVAEDLPREQPDHTFLRRLPQGDFVLFAGDLRHAKGLPVLLEAYASLADPPPLVLIGKACPETPRAFPPRVLALGEWPRAAVLAAWSRCLFGVVPSVWPEPFGMVLIEAMVCGKPVIASRIGGIPEVVVDGETGFLVPPGDVGALREAMAHLLAHPELRVRMGKASLERSFTYCEATVIPHIERVYEAAIRARR